MGEQTDNQQGQPPQKPSSGILKTYVEHPIFILVCGIATFVGTGFGIWGYCVSITKPELTYYISSTRIPLVQWNGMNKSNKFAVMILKGNAVDDIADDISAAEIQIWNQGKAPIHKADILKQVTIKTPRGEPIYQITTQPSREVIGFHCQEDTNYSGTLPLDWKVLEHNDGAKLQIIYGGTISMPFIVEGAIEGQPNGIKQYVISKNGHSQLNLIGGLSNVPLIVALVVASRRGLKRQKLNNEPFYKINIVLTITMLICLGTLSTINLYNYFSSLAKPPFGF